MEDVETKLDLLLEMYKDDRRRSMQQLQEIYEQTQQLICHTGLSQDMDSQRGSSYDSGGGDDSGGMASFGCSLPPPLSPVDAGALSIQSVPYHQISEPPTPVVRNPDKPMQRNLSDLGPRFKKRVTYRVNSSPAVEDHQRTGSVSEDPTQLTSILKKRPSESASPYDRYKRNAQLPPGRQMLTRGVTQDSQDSFPGWAHGEINTDSEPNSVHTSPRTDRYPSCNSTESELMSDAELDEFSPMTAPHGGDSSDLSGQDIGGPSASSPNGGADTPPKQTPEERNLHAFRMKPESQALLMRPEVLKLRKTTCWPVAAYLHQTDLKGRDHLINEFSITIQTIFQFRFTLMEILIQWSLQNFAHATTAQLSWHVQKFVVIGWPVI